MLRVLLPALLLLTGCSPTPLAAPPAVLSHSPAVFTLSMLEPIPPAAAPATTPEPPAATAPAPTPTPRLSSGGGGAGGGKPAPAAPTPAPTTEPARIISNTLDAGIGAIAGIVVDVTDGASPVANATVTLRFLAAPEKAAVLLAGPDGRFGLEGLALGAYTVEARHTGYLAAESPLQVQLYPSGSTVTDANLPLAQIQP